jgi:hypothetical protein
MAVSIECTRVAAATGGGNQDITISGFGTPKAAIFIVTKAIADDTAADQANLSFGVTDGTNQGACDVVADDGAVTSNTARIASTDEVIQIMDSGAGTIDGEANFNSWIPNGVRITWGNAPAAEYLITVVLLGGDDLSAFVNISSSLTATQVSETGFGFEPDVMVVASRGNQPFNDSAIIYAVLGVGFAVNDGSETQRSLNWGDMDGVGNTVVNAKLSTSAVIDCVVNDGQSSSLVLDSFDSDGVTWTPTGFSGDQVVFLALNFNGAAQAGISTQSMPSGAQTVSYTWPGFEPGLFMSLCFNDTVVDIMATSSDAEMFAIGVTDGTNEYINMIHSDDNVGTSDTKSLSTSGVSVGMSSEGASWNSTSGSVSFTATGYDIVYSASAFNRKMAHLVIEAPAAAASGTEESEGRFGSRWNRWRQLTR